jgi:hypothetical protein
MQKPTHIQPTKLGIERVAVVEELEVASVDVMTRSSSHASALELAFGITPFRFSRGQATLHAFARLPAIAARRWLENHGVAFTLTPDGLRPDGPVTWVQGGFA